MNPPKMLKFYIALEALSVIWGEIVMTDFKCLSKDYMYVHEYICILM